MTAAFKQQQGIFKRLNQSDRKRILSHVASDRVTIYIKTITDEIFGVKTETYEDEKFLCGALADSTKVPGNDQEVVVNFSHGHERYFFQGFLTVSANRAVITVPEVLYILQRRKAVRMNIPEKYNAGFNAIQFNGKAVFYEMRVLDFSSGGLRAFFPSTEQIFEIGQTFLGVLHLGIRRPLQVNSTVRYVGKKVHNGVEGQTFGIQFEGMDKNMEVKLLTVFMDMQREIFVKNYK
jgi:hypothetical protein